MLLNIQERGFVFNMNKTIKNVLRFLISLFIVLCLHFKPEIISGGLESPSVIGQMIMLFSVSFSAVSFSDILSLITIYLLLKYIDEKNIPHSILFLILSIALSCTYILCQSYYHYNGLDFVSGTKYQVIYSSILIIGFTVFLYNSIRFLSYTISGNNLFTFDSLSYSKIDIKILWRKIAFAMIICWLPWLLCDYPGSFCSDTTSQIQQFFGYVPLDASSPPFSTLLVGSIVFIGKSLVNANFGIFLYTLFHTIVSAVIYSYILVKLRLWGCNDKIIKLSLIYFCFLPMWGAYMEWFEKDPLYSAILSLFSFFILETIKNKECTLKDAVKLVLSGLLASVLRHNGFYTVIPTLIILFFFLKKNSKKYLISSAIIVFTVFELLSNVVYPAAGFKSVSSQSYMVIPFQMTARYIYTYGDSVTQEEKEIISAVLDYDKIAERYNPILSDPINLLYTENDAAIPQYLKTFVKMFFKHPNIYFSALLNMNYGYLAPVCPHVGIYFNYGQSEWESKFGINHIFKEMPVRLFEGFKENGNYWPILQYFCMAGAYTWLYLIMIFILIYNKKYYELLPFLPVAATFAFCIFSPCAAELRYMMPNLSMLPMFIGWTLYSLSLKKDEQ